MIAMTMLHSTDESCENCTNSRRGPVVTILFFGAAICRLCWPCIQAWTNELLRLADARLVEIIK